MGEFEVVVGAGTLRSDAESSVAFPHRWTAGGVAVEAAFTGAHLVHLAVAGCVLNDVYREAETLGLAIDGVRVRASGGFDTATWSSTGIEYSVEIASPAAPEEIEELVATVEAVAEIPKVISQGAPVVRSVSPRR